MVLQAIKYDRGSLQILDQLRLPHDFDYVEIKNPQDGWCAIRNMQVRGAPAIAIVAALSLAVHIASKDLEHFYPKESGPFAIFISQSLKFLTTSRPTAVNLVDAARKLENVAFEAHAKSGSTVENVAQAYIESAELMLRNDVQDNEAIGMHGAEWIEKQSGSMLSRGTLSVITHCNTGSLATAGYGTALGVIRSLHGRASLQNVFYTETRPYNQGARLTGFELIHDNIPAVLITDSMAGILLATKSLSDRIACVIVGADRVAANGDTANKIGTYTLAVLARYHGVKFLVAAPRTTVDRGTRFGADIVIEERPTSEMTSVKGPEAQLLKDGNMSFGTVKEVAIAAKGTQAWNPAFDVTPAALIDGIVTERGVIEKDTFGSFHLDTIFEKGTGGEMVVEETTKAAKALNGAHCWDEVLQMRADEVKPWASWINGFA